MWNREVIFLFGLFQLNNSGMRLEWAEIVRTGTAKIGVFAL